MGGKRRLETTPDSFQRTLKSILRIRLIPFSRGKPCLLEQNLFPIPLEYYYSKEERKEGRQQWGKIVFSDRENVQGKEMRKQGLKTGLDVSHSRFHPPVAPVVCQFLELASHHDVVSREILDVLLLLLVLPSSLSDYLRSIDLVFEKQLDNEIRSMRFPIFLPFYSRHISCMCFVYILFRLTFQSTASTRRDSLVKPFRRPIRPAGSRKYTALG